MPVVHDAIANGWTSRHGSVARDAGDCEGGVAHRPDVPESEPAEFAGRRLGEGDRGETEGETDQQGGVPPDHFAR